MTSLSRWVCAVITSLGLAGLSGCTTTSLLLSAAGVATDTSMTWEIVKHLHAKLTEGDPAACASLDSVERALSPRCGSFVVGSVRSDDIASSPFGACAVTTAAGDARLWPALPELMAKGARSESCTQPALVALAQANDCPDLAHTSIAVRTAFTELATTDPRSVHHDVVRWLSCPNSRAVGADQVLTIWLDRGALDPASVPFSPLSALHPSAIGSPLSLALEARGNRVDAALGGYVGLRPSGFEEALRTSDWAALEWWLTRRPQLATRVPGPQLDWLPLARVLAPGFLVHPERREETVGFLLAYGANPRARLPSDPSQTVVALARSMRSPLADLLESAPSQAVERSPRLAADSRALRLAGQQQ